ncbi:MAG: D-alanyl-D-alanine carboxypeptidase family protein [Hydrococcus sp. C42_A2020_068]|uniref:M15 family metallopeptidase n=1 Tax=Pleurocapsa sp. PCC 7327 TaxID=118163 RepID=UPI00059C6C3E|nr:M15 family metallopeptidase [Pleurocapsa sp. PCC 7327]MBF2022686.1 D-alanyl-D-alanine carboxypeptidase family protein [Hydrococcus sp. C42_A2020_068]
MDEIPEALRDSPKSKQSSRPLPLFLIGFSLGLGMLAIVVGVLLFRSPAKVPQKSAATVTPTPTTPAPTPTSKPVENVLGHLPYEEAPESELKAITPDGRIRMRLAAAEAFLQLQAAARADGIILTPISGFRSVREQNRLFFEVKQQRNQEASKRAEVSAPPGYSEHHTGYAIDLGDGRSPATNLSVSFEKTPAFRWLKNNANRYSFELSFPPNNPQGVSYEPWHWRYVGDRKSLETFYKARELKQPIDNSQ